LEPHTHHWTSPSQLDTEVILCDRAESHGPF
jgi:hypothetical protein